MAIFPNFFFFCIQNVCCIFNRGLVLVCVFVCLNTKYMYVCMTIASLPLCLSYYVIACHPSYLQSFESRRAHCTPYMTFSSMFIYTNSFFPQLLLCLQLNCIEIFRTQAPNKNIREKRWRMYIHPKMTVNSIRLTVAHE